jgi:phosphoribosylaminoimidazole-succinocarboxamide synthase
MIRRCKIGSVKDLKILKEPDENNLGKARFIFSDRYSVFDWGDIPDYIPNKGSAIALLGAYFFERLSERGVSTHYIRLVEEERLKNFLLLRNL